MDWRDLFEWPIVPLVLQELCLIRGKTHVAMVTDNSMPKQIKHCVATLEGSVFSHTGNN